MNALLVITCCLLVIVQPVNCQQAVENLQPWLKGTIAVTVFLALAGAAFVINKVWCQNKDNPLDEKNKEISKADHKEEMAISNGTEGKYTATAADFRCKEGPHVYENPVEFDCGNTTVHVDEIAIEVLTTSM